MWKSLEFWLAVGAACLVKIRTSRQLGPWQVVMTLAVAVAAAYVATDYAVQVTGVAEPVAAALVALTAEGVMRWILIALDDPREAVLLWRSWWKK